MIVEVNNASSFITRLLPATVTTEKRALFQAALRDLMLRKFHNHWNPQLPSRGSAYRSIQTYHGTIDALLLHAAAVAGIQNISKSMPLEFTLWIDPFNVSCRFGDRGAVSVVYEDDRTESNENVVSVTGKDTGNNRVLAMG